MRGLRTSGGRVNSALSRINVIIYNYVIIHTYDPDRVSGMNDRAARRAHATNHTCHRAHQPGHPRRRRRLMARMRDAEPDAPYIHEEAEPGAHEAKLRTYAALLALGVGR